MKPADSQKLRANAVRGLSWSAIENVARQGINLFVAIILARLLLPEQFGLVAMITVFLAVSQALLDGGFAMALIQKRDATYVDECSIF